MSFLPSSDEQTDTLRRTLEMREPPGRLGQIVRRLKQRAEGARDGMAIIVAPAATQED
jgi:hypothetical protein